jgi:hypothetical protein
LVDIISVTSFLIPRRMTLPVGVPSRYCSWSMSLSFSIILDSLHPSPGKLLLGGVFNDLDIPHKLKAVPPRKKHGKNPC